MKKRFMTNLLVIPLGLLMLASAPVQAGSKLVPVYKPEPMQLDGSKSAGAVKEAITRAATARDWKTRPAGKGILRATYAKTGKVGVVYKAVVNITYSSKSIKIRYHDSRDLDYQKESQLISKYYDSWVKKLEKQIWKEVNR